MTSYRQIFRAYAGGTKGADRIQAMRHEAAKEPRGTAEWMLALVLWEEGEIAEANQLAEMFLEESPDDFHMLIVCLDFNIRADNPAAMLAYATRLTDVRKPSRLRRALGVLFRPRIWPSRLFGRGPTVKISEEILDDWVLWARAYLDARRGDSDRGFADRS